MADPATGDTWGISGPTFLALYGAARRRWSGPGGCWTRRAGPRGPRRRSGRRRPHPPPAGRRLPQRRRPAGHLLGAERDAAARLGRAVRAARAGRRARSGRARPSWSGRSTRTATTPVHRVALPAQAAGGAPRWTPSASGWSRAGLLVSDERPAPAAPDRAAGWLAVAALGLFRLLAGMAERAAGRVPGRWRWSSCSVAAVVMLGAVPRRTRLRRPGAGRAAVPAARPRTRPSKPDWTVYGPVGGGAGRRAVRRRARCGRRTRRWPPSSRRSGRPRGGVAAAAPAAAAAAAAAAAGGGGGCGGGGCGG